MEKEQKKILESTLKNIRKNYGDGAVMLLGDIEKLPVVTRVSSGILPLDVILGGGYPEGRIVELYGVESSGKTTVCLRAIAQAQADGHICGFIDAEHALDIEYAKALGVNVDELVLSQPDNGEMALEILEEFIRSGVFKVLVVDSVAALVPKAEIDGEMGDANIGLQARLMSKAMRKLVGVTSKSGCVVLFTNQIREKVGVMYGNPETTTGGRALKFYSSVRLEMRKKEVIKGDGGAVGNCVKIKTVKNKVYPPFKETEFNIIFGKGPDEDGCIIDLGIEFGLIEKAGSWFTYEGERYHGKEALENYLHQPGNETLFADLKQQVYDLAIENNKKSDTPKQPEPEETVTEF